MGTHVFPTPGFFSGWRAHVEVDLLVLFWVLHSSSIHVALKSCAYFSVPGMCVSVSPGCSPAAIPLDYQMSPYKAHLLET